jgi:hypothetical protein
VAFRELISITIKFSCLHFQASCGGNNKINNILCVVQKLACVSLIDFFFPPYNILKPLTLVLLESRIFQSLGKEIVNSQTQTLDYLSTFLHVLVFCLIMGGVNKKNSTPKHGPKMCLGMPR